MTEESRKPEAAVAIVRACEPVESILLIRRSEREDDSWSGHWSFPGGRRDSQDRDLLETATRELEEECGIRLGAQQKEAVLAPVVARRAVGRFLLVAPFVFAVDSELPTVLDTREAVEAVWIPISILVDPAQHHLLCVPRRPKELLYPGIQLNGVPLWGFTYRLITSWLNLLPTGSSVEQAGFKVASLVLQFLLSYGLKLKQEWKMQSSQATMTNLDVVKTAVVEGKIPVDLVRARFASPGPEFPIVNVLEVQPNCIRVTGLAFEEYLIVASA